VVDEHGRAATCLVCTISGSDKVSPETAARVLKAISDLNFIPDTNARALGSGRSSLLGLIISDITNPFFPELVKAFENIAIGQGREVLIANTNYDPHRTMHCVTRMIQRKVDGVAIMTSEMDEHLIDFFRRSQIPLVFLDVGTPGLGISCIHIDYSAGVEMAMSHLVGLGHRRIGFISGIHRFCPETPSVAYCFVGSGAAAAFLDPLSLRQSLRVSAFCFSSRSRSRSYAASAR
jgi:DNA-binding LacI/PurR family transcriptional regulator